MNYNCFFNLSQRQIYFIGIISILSFVFGPVMLAIHYETHVDITFPVLIISFIFTVFWGLIFGALTVGLLFVIGFLFLQYMCEECCGEDSTSYDLEQEVQ